MKKIKINIEGGDGKNTVDAAQWEEGWDMVSHLSDGIEQDLLADDSTITGQLSVPVASKSKVARINARFGDVVKVDEALQQFEDKEVMKVIGEGAPLTVREMSDITDIGVIFSNNKSIETFEELISTNVTSLVSVSTSTERRGAFSGCTNLKKVNIENIENIGMFAFFKTAIFGIFAPKATVVAEQYSYQQGLGAHCPNLVYAFFPAAITFSSGIYNNNEFYNSPNMKVCDIGRNLTRIHPNLFDTTVPNLVIRASSVPSKIGSSNIKYKVFVPAESVSSYADVFTTQLVYAISGPEWVAEFGSEYAFADVVKYVDDIAEQQKIVDAYEEGHSMTHPMQAKTWALFLGEFSDGMEVSQWRNKVTLHLDTKSPFTEGQWRIVGTGATLEGNVLTIADDADGAEVTLAATSVADPTKTERVTVKVWDYYHKHERLVADDAVMDVLVKNLGGAALTREQCVAYNGDMRNWFNGNTEIETFEEFGALFPNIDMSIPDTLTNYVFRDCINLRKVNCDSLNFVTGYMFYNTPKLQENICFLNARETRNYAFQGSGVKRVFMPKLEACEYMTFRNWENAELIDLGSNLNTLAYYNIWMLTANPLCVCRAAVPPIGNSNNGGLIDGTAFGNARIVFVPVGKISAYESAMNPSSRSQFTGHFAEIGGTEWVAEFGSADEYADIDKYVTDPVEAEKIKAAYREAATA